MCQETSAKLVDISRKAVSVATDLSVQAVLSLF